MCGITGAVWSDERLAVGAADLRRMTDVLRHRGPDDDGSYRSEMRHVGARDQCPGVALGFRRLAIIDLEKGNQPIPNEDESVWVVFNGEIYNYRALRRRLEGAGHQLKTQGDAEVIVHLYEELGVGCFAELNGMFAMAIWDARHRRLVLARDRFGQKPLVYTHTAGRLSFASELKSLRQLPQQPATLDLAAIDAYLTLQYIPHPRTVFTEIRKLPPASYAVYENDELLIDRYWQLDPERRFRGRRDEATEALRELMDDAIRLRLQSDVPLGAFLSGGVDSSIIVARMQAVGADRVKTFSIGFSERQYDESAFAREVAQALGTEHHEEIVDPSALEVLDRLVWHFDEPFGDSSAIPTWYVSRMTRQHVTVCLSGDGGDELFLGYPRYRAVALAEYLDQCPPLRALCAAAWWQRLPASAEQKSRLRQFRRFSEAIRQSPVRRYADWISIFNERRRAELYTDDFLSQLGDEDPVRFLEVVWNSARKRTAVESAAWTDLHTYLTCDLMTKVDITSMAHSLECRQPFLDYRVAELAVSFPQQWHFRRQRGKRMLHRLYADQLPQRVFQRRKMGFGVPLDHWFRGELRDCTRDLLLDSSAITRSWFRREVVEQLIREHEQRTFDHAYRLWALLFLETWLRANARSTTAAAE